MSQDNLRAAPGARIGGTDVSLNELLYTLKITDRLDAFRNAADDILILRAVKAENLSATGTELQEEADSLRQQLGLLSAADTETWMRQRHLSLDDFEQYVCRRVTARKLQDRLVGPKIESFFVANRAGLDVAGLWRIVVENEEVAREVTTALARPGASFAALARKFTLDAATRDAGGYSGHMLRMAMDPELATAVFLASPGAIVGPVRTQAGYEIVHVEEIRRASMNDHTRAVISDLLFNKWLQAGREEAGVQLAFVDQIVAPEA